jgi:hypothetical protein
MIVLFNEFGCDVWGFRPAVRPCELRGGYSTSCPPLGFAVSTRAQMAYQDSAQSFVRALRAPTDPPKQAGPSKIDIASAAWHETSFHVPRKAETILEWCLTRLLKDGTRRP